MKKRNQFVLMFMITASLWAQNAHEILDKMEKIMTPVSSKGIMTQTIKTSTGAQRVLKYEYYTGEKGKHTLMRYLKPSRSKGMAILMRDHSSKIWMYNQRTRRVRLLASSAKNQNFENSDFTYEDMGGGESWSDKYSAKRLGDTKESDFVLALTPRDNASGSYTKLVITIRKKDYYPLTIDYYKGDASAFKTLYFDDIRVVEDIPTAFSLKMENHITGSITTMNIVEITYNIDLDDSFFTEKNLRK